MTDSQQSYATFDKVTPTFNKVACRTWQVVPTFGEWRN